MLITSQENIVRACALILTPNLEFKEWLKTAALKEQLFPASIDRLVDEESLFHHSVSFITPVFHGQEDVGDFISKHYEFIFHSLLLAWPFSTQVWQESTRKQSLHEMFDVSYYFYLVNMLRARSDAKMLRCSVTTLRPKPACLEWIHESGIDELEDLALDMLRKFGVALLTPSFASKEEENLFVQEHCKRIWELGLSSYCEDESLWPEGRTYERLQEWFDCSTCYPVVDLSQKRLT